MSKAKFMTREEALRMQQGTVDECLLITNEVLSRVYNKAVEDALKSTPELMLKLFVSQQAQAKMKKEFYHKNPDFIEHTKIVQATVQEIEAANPGKEYDFILSLAEPLIRGRIRKYKEMMALSLDKPTGFVQERKE